MKKVTKKLVALALALAIAVTPAMEVSAKQTIGVSWLSANLKEATFQLIRTGSNYTEVRVMNYKGKVVSTATGLSLPTVKGLKKKTAYTAQFCELDDNDTQITDWSEKVGFITFEKFSIKKAKGKMAARLKLPKIKGVKKYEVAISKKRDKGFKKVKNGKPGKTLTIKKFKGKAMKYYVNYYLKITPKVKGAKYNTPVITGFYFTKRYTF